jgi:ankyrin repeat protein
MSSTTTITTITKPLRIFFFVVFVSVVVFVAPGVAQEPRSDGTTVLMLAAERGDVELARKFARSASINARNEYGATALYTAVASGNIAIVRLLLAEKADPDVPLLSGETPLMAAADNGDLEAARLLIDSGANVNANEKNGGQTALMWAAAERASAIVRLLVERGADVRARSKGGFTPLLFAAQQGDVESGRVLLQAAADVNERTAAGDMTVLMVAVASSNAAFARLLLDSGANANLADRNGYTALHFAALDKDGADVVQALAAHGAQINARTTRDTRANTTSGVSVQGATPLFLAAARGHAQNVRALLAAGADPLMPTERGTAPLHVATWGGDPYFRDWTEVEKKDLFEITKLLVARGADVNSAGEHGWTALHGAAYKGVDPIVQFLIDAGARTEVFDEYGQTPLSIANAVITVGSKDAYYQSSRVVRKSTSDLLLKLGARPLTESGVRILDLFYKQQ